MNLLIVNDEELTAETMKSDMDWKKYGIEQVYTAYDAEQAREVIQEKSVNILLCDIEMPGDNGIELLRWVRQEELPIECIFLTCHPSFEYAREAINLGCQNYILVPAQYEDIGVVVQMVAERIVTSQRMKEYAEYGRQLVDEHIQQTAESHGIKKSGKELGRDIKAYIHQHLGEAELSVNELGDIFYMHPVHVNRIFKKEYGRSVSQYIMEARMKLAAQLIKTGQLNITCIAEQVGYRGYSNFNHAFKKYYGCNPSDYLR